MRDKDSGRGHQRETGAPAGMRPAAHYLTIPSLNAVQKEIAGKHDIRVPCCILAELNRIFPLNIQSENPNEALLLALKQWLESFIPERVVNLMDLSVQILPADQVDCELYDGVEEGDTVIQFACGGFLNSYFPLGDIIKEYDGRNPGLGKYVLKMLSACPLIIGTPENIYEQASFACWCDEENEESTFSEYYDDLIENGESEEEARDQASEMILICYDEFTDHLPEWSFERKRRKVRYSGPIPKELENLNRYFHTYRRWKKVNYLFPQISYPAAVAPFDRESYDFMCEVINRVANEQLQYGCDYTFAGMAWHFSVEEPLGIRSILREIEFLLGYFGHCIDFLMDHEKEYSHA